MSSYFQELFKHKRWVDFLILSVILTSKWLGRPSIVGILINSIIIFLVIFGLRVISNFFLEAITITSEEPVFKKEESVSLTTIIENNDTIPVYSSHRVWRDNYGNNFEGKLSVRDKDYLRLKDKLKNVTITTKIATRNI